jgi:hypothetical protein
MHALAGAHDAAVQMIDTSIVRVHQHACLPHPKQKAVYGPITRRVDQQDSCSGRWEWPAGLARSDGW